MVILKLKKIEVGGWVGGNGMFYCFDKMKTPIINWRRVKKWVSKFFLSFFVCLFLSFEFKIELKRVFLKFWK